MEKKRKWKNVREKEAEQYESGKKKKVQNWERVKKKKRTQQWKGRIFVKKIKTNWEVK